MVSINNSNRSCVVLNSFTSPPRCILQWKLTRSCRATLLCTEYLPSLCLGTSTWCQAELFSRFKMYGLRRPGKKERLMLYSYKCLQWMKHYQNRKGCAASWTFHQHLRCFVSNQFLVYVSRDGHVYEYKVVE